MPVEIFDELPGAASSGGLTEIQRNITSSLRFPAYGDDPAVFTGAPKVTVTRDSDGTKILDAIEATEVAETEDDIQHFVVDIKGTDIPEVDRLEVVWSDGTSAYTTWCEVVGGFLVSLRAIEKKADLTTARPTGEVVEAREMSLRGIEDACGVAFRRRYAREVLDGSGTNNLFLGNPRLVKILSVTVGGEAVEVDTLGVDVAGVAVAPTTWKRGQANVEVTYVHGYDFPLAALPVRDLAAFLLKPSPTDWNERATSATTGDTTYALVTAGVRGADFPLPTVNAFVDSHRFPAVG
jgi:hypothetical protein